MSRTQYDPKAEIDRRLIAAGASKTIYALVMPETERVLIETVAPAAGRGATEPDERTFSEWLDIYHGAWTKRQDHVHLDFFSAWRDWVRPVATIGNRFAFAYPTAGASEGLFHLIASYGNTARKEKFEPTIHVFAGEYEGYLAYAEQQFIPVRRHSRNAWDATLDQIGPRDQVYISQPSAIDCNLWPDFERFIAALHQRQPMAAVIADLTYVGAVARDYHVNVDHPNVAAVVLSLSKPMGVYYHRIGGVLSQAEVPSLFGNRWFKNLLSLRYGTRLLRHFAVHELPRKYAPLQERAAAKVAAQFNLPIKPADVMLIGNASADLFAATSTEMASYLTRPGAGRTELIRLCLTPGMAELIEPSAPHRRMAETLVPERPIS